MGRVRALSIAQMIIGLLIQTSALHVFGMNQFAPNLFVAALIPAALLFGPIYGLACGYIGGLIIDLLTGYGLGLSAIPFMIGGFIAGILKEYINDRHYLSAVAFAIVTMILYDTFMFLSLYFSRSVLVVNLSVVFQSIMVILLTSGATILMHIWLHRSSDTQLRRNRMKSGFGN